MVYVNGRFVRYCEATVSIEDRGYQFADGIYEVIRVYGGKVFMLDEHLQRLARSAAAIDLPLPDLTALRRDALELLTRNGFPDSIIYIQVTRGACPRRHQYPDGLAPTVVMTARKMDMHPARFRQEGVSVISVADDRWARCHIKSISLLSNILAKQKAHKQGAFEAIYVRDGFVTEGTNTNVFVVEDGAIVTPPLTNYILPGVTRRAVLNLAARLAIPRREEPVSVDRLFAATAVFLTGTTTEVMPVVSIDGRPVGDGRPGPVASCLFEGYMDLAYREGEPVL
ncbi:MAG: D-amino-acid transaminase [Firmicutes bacterium]|nr:D-amino-acid transaminase [Bacillota bacterium]